MKFKNAAYKTYPYIIIFFLALFIEMMNPFNPLSNPSTYDSSIFAYIGRIMTNGKVPYIDAWDNKGPFLYFLEYLGMLINGNFGIFIVGLFFMFAFGVFIYKTGKLFANSAVSLAAVMFCFFSLSVVFEGGNMTESYALPLISCSLYLLTKGLLLGKIKWFYVVAIGACSAGCFMLRINLMAPILAYCAVIFIYSIFEKRIVYAFSLIGNFLLGFAIAIAPFLVYLIKNKALTACIDAAYTSNFVKPSKVMILRTLQSFYSYFISNYAIGIFICFALCSLILLISKQIKDKNMNILIICNIFSFLINVGANVISGYSYPHYTMSFIAIAVFPVIIFLKIGYKIFAELFSKINFSNLKASKNFVSSIVIISFVIFISISNINGIISNIVYTFENKNKYIYTIEKIDNYTDENDLVQACGVSPEAFLISKVESASKYFYAPFGPAFSPEFKIEARDEIAKDIMGKKPKLVMISKEYKTFFEDESAQPYLPEFLNENYRLAEEYNNIYWYVLN